MKIETGLMKDPYVTLPVEVKGETINIIVKLDDEGVVVDAFHEDDDSDPIASTWKLYQEMIDGE
jgi:hypothetical protein